MVKVSVITPCFNEEDNVTRCHAEVRDALRAIDPPVDWEHIFTDNASTDGTVRLLTQIAETDPHVRILVNHRNIGPFRNIASGMRHVAPDADVVVPMVPADLQDPPEVIAQMVRVMQESNVDIVYGVRTNRRESFLLRLGRGAYYRLLSLLRATAPPPHAGEFMLITRDVLHQVNATRDDHPYVRGLVARTGLPSRSVPYQWRTRDVGTSRNSWFDLFDQGLNGLIKTSRVPARLSLVVGLVVALTGFAVAIATVIARLTDTLNTVQGIPSILTAVLVLGGVQMIFLGIVGEYVIDIHSHLRSHADTHEPVELTRPPVN